MVIILYVHYIIRGSKYSEAVRKLKVRTMLRDHNFEKKHVFRRYSWLFSEFFLHNTSTFAIKQIFLRNKEKHAGRQDSDNTLVLKRQLWLKIR